jgi:hypothetical protein
MHALSLEIFMRVFSMISFCACFLVIIVYLSSSKLRRKGSNVTVFYIAVSDLMSSVGGLIGVVKSGSPACYVQTILTTYFPLTSMFWTTIIAIYLYDMISRSSNSLLLDRNKPAYHWLHIIGWGLPLILTFSPLVTETFGTFDGEDGWCFLKHREEYPNWTFTFWVIVSFFGWEYLSLFFYLALMVYIMVSLSRSSKDVISDEIYRKILDNIKKLIWYPLIILFSWMMLSILTIWSAINPTAQLVVSPQYGMGAYTTPLLSGTLTSIAFFLSSDEAVICLYKLMRCQGGPNLHLNDAVVGAQDSPQEFSGLLFSHDCFGLLRLTRSNKVQDESAPADPLPNDLTCPP